MPCPQPDDPTPTAGPSRSAGSSATDPAKPTAACVRCRSSSATAFFRDASYCRSCAALVFDGKTKPGLELARGAGLAKYVDAVSIDSLAGEGEQPQHMDVSASIAIAFSGGINSRVLLSSARQYFRPQATDSGSNARLVGQKKSRTGANVAHNTGRFSEVAKLYVLYVDDSAVVSEADDRTDEVRRLVEQEGCPDIEFVPLRLEDVYRSAGDDSRGLPWELHESEDQRISASPIAVQDPRQAIKDLFTAIFPSDTPRTAVSSARTRAEDLHRILIQHLLRRAAAERGCSALLLGESGTRTSIRLIESLAKGAGHKLAVEGNEACWVDDTLVVRPLKALLAQEIRWFAEANGLEYLEGGELVPPTVKVGEMMGETPVMDKSSIARLTESFILNLERGVPSTVSTVGRTGSKLTLNSSSKSSGADANAKGAAFEVVGPSVRLDSRSGRQAEALSQIEHGVETMSIASTVAAEPRIGAKAMRLATASRACFRWTTKSGCAMCGMPAQPDARFWKRNITIDSLSHVAPTLPPTATDDKTDTNYLNLADHLCYSCLLVLVPSSTAPCSLLPPHVLSSILNTQQHSDHPSVLPMDSTSANRQHPESITHKLDRSEMKAQINEFLIDP
ncbi:hypothetical protein BCV70DRAFT_76399 [Testicularia cyperi]|uniref:Cytoplasmic tRNA 2-thiolation protein 2 n=1 Tax=Testicularia cyperi TaxID=1882483 RepID=A0A317XW32_9BASI|nr:hypothetical protein BCV70DRAFT_76399 [Testicularia cyperi]